jgi:hypothetical protein
LERAFLAFDVTFAEVVAPIASIRIGTEQLYRKFELSEGSVG